MATRFFASSILTAKQTLSLVLSRSYPSPFFCKPPSSLTRLRPLVSLAAHFHRFSPASTTIRSFATRQTSSSLNDPNPNWSNRPPKETILLDGCDFEHWLVVMEKPEGDPTRDEIIDSYIKTLAQVVGSEEEARMKIYSVSTKHYFAFGALVSEELSYKLKELPKVRWVLPDSYLDVKNKDYGGEPFINGQAVPYDPKYHEEWVRNNARANERNRRNDRPRNFDRSRNFERRRENMQNRGAPNPGFNMGGTPHGNMGGMPPNNMGGGPPDMGGMPPSNMGSMPQNMGQMTPNNMGGSPPNMGGAPNMGGVLPNVGSTQNMGGMPPSNMGGGPPNMGGMAQNMEQMTPNNMGGSPPSMGGAPNMGGVPPNMGGTPNMGGIQPNNMGGVPNNAPNFQYRGGPNSGGMHFQNREMTGSGQNQHGYSPNSSGGNPYQPQNVPGRDMPLPPPPPPPNYH